MTLRIFRTVRGACPAGRAFGTDDSESQPNYAAGAESGARYFFAEHVRFCRVEDGVIFLDLRKNRYFGLSAMDAASLANVVPDVPIPALPRDSDHAPPPDRALTLADTFARNGWLAQSVQSIRSSNAVDLEQLDAIGIPGYSAAAPGISVLHTLRFLASIIVTKAMLKTMRLEQIVERIRRRKEVHSTDGFQASASAAIELVRIYRWLRPFFYSAQGVCLFDSLALVEFLRCYRVYPTWVIGVQTKPFGAHSWVQINGLVLNESMEKAQTYTPILTV